MPPGRTPGNAPFGLGKTFFNGTTVPSSSDYGTSQDLEGMTYVFENRAVTDPITGRPGTVECVLVRNVAAVALLPGYAVQWAAGYEGRRVDGNVYVTAQEVAGIVDDKLPTAGVPVGDLFWLVRKGKVLAYMSREADASSTIALRAFLVARTAATSGATTAGRLQLSQISLATSANLGSVYQDNLMNCVGRAASAKTSANTNVQFLVDLNLSN